MSPTFEVYGAIAREANVAVVFVRNQAGDVLQCLWNLETDEVVHGQWIRKHIYTFSLSPNARYLAATIGEGPGQNKAPWIAVSRPPYFTALALWHVESGRDEGRWFDNSRMFLDVEQKPKVGKKPEGIAVEQGCTRNSGTFWGHLWFRWPGYEAQLEPRPPDPRRWFKAISGGCLIREEYHDGHTCYRIMDESSAERMTLTAEPGQKLWLDFDFRERIVYGDQGCLWAWAGFPEGNPRLIAELHELEFEPVQAPDWAKEW